MAFEEVQTDYWKPSDEGDAVEGVLIEKQSDIGQNKSMLYTVQDVEGNSINVWGSTVLDPLMLGAKIGDMIRITFKGLGEAKGGRNAPKLFKVEVDKGFVAPEDNQQ